MNVLYPIEVSVAFKYYYYYSVLFGNGAMIEAKKCWLMSAKLPGGGGVNALAISLYQGGGKHI